MLIASMLSRRVNVAQSWFLVEVIDVFDVGGIFGWAVAKGGRLPREFK